MTAAAALLMFAQIADAKVNYTSKDGRSMCCTSVGPSGWAAQGCTANPGGGQCAAIAKAHTSDISIDKLGKVHGAPKISEAKN